jgi:hypothetical protein
LYFCLKHWNFIAQNDKIGGAMPKTLAHFAGTD